MSEGFLQELKTLDRFRDLPAQELQRMADLAARLRGVSLFDTVSDHDLLDIARLGRLEHHGPGDMVIHEGDTDKIFYVILKGQVRVWVKENGTPRLRNYHGEGDFFGELAPLHNQPRQANVDVVDDVDLVAFEPEGFARITAHEQIDQYLRDWGQQRIRRSNRPFEGKHWDEISVVLAHKSWVALMRMVLFPIAIVVLTLTVWAVLRLFAEVSSQVMASIGVSITVGMGLWIFWMWEDWRNDDLIVTSKRIIHIERILVPPFPVERHEAYIEQIQDIITRNHGLWTWLFGVRSLEVKTAGAGVIQFPYLDDADGIREEIFFARDLAQIRRLGEERGRIRQKLFTELGRAKPEAIVALESGEELRVTPEPTGLWMVFDYFIPRSRIVRRDQIVWRKHWLVLLRQVGPPAALLVLFLVLLILGSVGPGLLGQLPIYITVAAPIVGLVAAFLWYWWRYDGWRNDVYIVTDTRIIDIEGSPFHLQKESRREGTFDIIQNIDYSSPNWLFRILRVGSVTIDTAAQQKAFTFDLVPSPEEVQQEIFKRLFAYREKGRHEESERRYTEFARWFETYHHSVIEQKE